MELLKCSSSSGALELASTMLLTVTRCPEGWSCGFLSFPCQIFMPLYVGKHRCRTLTRFNRFSSDKPFRPVQAKIGTADSPTRRACEICQAGQTSIQHVVISYSFRHQSGVFFLPCDTYFCSLLWVQLWRLKQVLCTIIWLFMQTTIPGKQEHTRNHLISSTVT